MSFIVSSQYYIVPTGSFHNCSAIPFADVRQTQTEDKVDITASRTSPRCGVAVPPQRALLGPWPVFFGISSFSILAHHLISSAKICWLTRHFPWLTCRGGKRVASQEDGFEHSHIYLFMFLAIVYVWLQPRRLNSGLDCSTPE